MWEGRGPRGKSGEFQGRAFVSTPSRTSLTFPSLLSSFFRIHCFENVTAIVFLVAISEYDMRLYEDESVVRPLSAVWLFPSSRLRADSPLLSISFLEPNARGSHSLRLDLQLQVVRSNVDREPNFFLLNTVFSVDFSLTLLVHPHLHRSSSSTRSISSPRSFLSVLSRIGSTLTPETTATTRHVRLSWISSFR